MDYSVTRVESAVDWRKLKDEFQLSSHLCSRGHAPAGFFSNKLRILKESSCEARIQILATEGRNYGTRGIAGS
jgi:hypothetical protein